MEEIETLQQLAVEKKGKKGNFELILIIDCLVEVESRIACIESKLQKNGFGHS